MIKTELTIKKAGSENAKVNPWVHRMCLSDSSPRSHASSGAGAGGGFDA
jgi:hypothetical protein